MLTRLTEAVRAEDADQILVTGDLVQIGLPGEIEAAAEWLAELGPPERVRLVPGNHDAYAADSWAALARSWNPYLGIGDGLTAAAAEAAFPTRRSVGHDAGGVTVIGLSSASPSPLFMAYGALGADQRARLDAMLCDAAGFRCLLLHHPPLPAMTSRRKGLRDAAALQALLTRHGAHLLLHGHVHRNAGSAGPGDLRVFGTASASSAGGKGQAAYRRFDVEADPEGDGWSVSMHLLEVTTGQVREAAHERWRAPFIPPTRPAAG